MRTLVLIVLVHVVLQTIFLPSSQCARLSPNDDNLIEQTCKQTPNYNLCISSPFADESTLDVVNRVNSCEERFAGNSPVTTENTNVKNVARVANAIVKQLLK
ncbi:uncharacterized protein LOC115966619 [Quercus lobata]|uniref:uncharacterized protein LOC115966619 n=1 Tax=Quercus lobata TaxID=97700 RepID=UPI0012457B92|nr:uncharacterized protein LOC115966619 [Quercus lobata]